MTLRLRTFSVFCHTKRVSRAPSSTSAPPAPALPRARLGGAPNEGPLHRRGPPNAPTARRAAARGPKGRGAPLIKARRCAPCGVHCAHTRVRTRGNGGDVYTRARAKAAAPREMRVADLFAGVANPNNLTLTPNT